LAYLYELVPTSRNDDRILWIWRESHARNPIGVTLLGDGEFAVAEGVPQLDCSVARTRDDLTVVSREGDGENIGGVADETTSCDTGGEFPETKGLVP